MSRFDSLTLALDGRFDCQLSNLSDVLRERIGREFCAMPWDELSADQRRSVALQIDYQDDPATEHERRYWWDFYEHRGTRVAGIAESEAKPASTAGEVAQREDRLAKLRADLECLEQTARPQGARYEPAGEDGGFGATSTSEGHDSHAQYVAYPRAMQQLMGRLNSTPEELAAWVWLGPRQGGLTAYLHIKDINPPTRFSYGDFFESKPDPDYVSKLMACWFRQDEIARFEPTKRFITGSALIDRWSNLHGLKPEAFIRAKIRESRLQDLHPVHGITQGSAPEEVFRPPMTTALFLLSGVEAIESEEFPIEWEGSIRNEVPSSTTSSRLISSEAALANHAGEQLPESPRSAADTASPPAEIASAPSLSRPCEAFLSMPNLRADELTITFVGDKADSGLGANNMVEISARNTTRRVALAALDLVDRRKGGPNSQAVILLGMATGRRLASSQPNSTKMMRLRGALRGSLGITGDPFQPYRANDGWMPLFAVSDKRGAADARAKLEAERRMESFDELEERGTNGHQHQESPRSFISEGDAADAWLQENERGNAA